MKKIIIALALSMAMVSCDEEIKMNYWNSNCTDDKCVLMGYIMDTGEVVASANHLYIQDDPIYNGQTIEDAHIYLCEEGEEVIEIERYDENSYRLEPGKYLIDRSKRYSLKSVSQTCGTVSSEPYYMPDKVNIDTIEFYRPESFSDNNVYEVGFESPKKSCYWLRCTPFRKGKELYDKRVITQTLEGHGNSTISTSLKFDFDSAKVDLLHIDDRLFEVEKQFVRGARLGDEYMEVMKPCYSNVDNGHGFVVNCAVSTVFCPVVKEIREAPSISFE